MNPAMMGAIACPHASSPVGYTAPLDIVSGAVVAYSQRALGSAKLGSALYTIREGAGDTTQSFSADAVTGEAPVSDIQTFLNSASGFITLWNDQGTTGANAAQATSSKQPEWTAGEVGGKPGNVFTHASLQYLASSLSATFNGSMTAFIVAQSTAPGNQLFGMNGSDNNGNGYVAIKADSLDYYTDSNNFEIGGLFDLTPDTNYHLRDFVLVNAGTEYKLDNAALPENTVFDSGIPASISAPVAIGASDTTGSITNFWGGGIVEVIFYDGVLTTQQRDLIRQNIATYYGITLS